MEGDASSASYFIALGALAPARPGHNGITIEGVGEASIQGDIRFVEAARLMGADIRSEANRLHISRGSWPLKAIDLDCNHIPDAAMTLAVMALFADGTTTLRNIASWRVKETDRIAAMAIESRKLGAVIEEGPDFIRITPPASVQDWKAASIHTYDDHRVAMCFSLAAFNPAGLPVRIEDPKCVGKTFPDYFEALFSVCEAAPRARFRCCASTVRPPPAKARWQQNGHPAGLPPAGLRRAVPPRRAGCRAPRPGHRRRWMQHAEHARIAGRLAADLQVLSSSSASGWTTKTSPTPSAPKRQAWRRRACRRCPWCARPCCACNTAFGSLPGLVADGRDMGTVIFPDARPQGVFDRQRRGRAQRRHKQLISKGISAKLDIFWLIWRRAMHGIHPAPTRLSSLPKMPCYWTTPT